MTNVQDQNCSLVFFLGGRFKENFVSLNNMIWLLKIEASDSLFIFDE